jgi:hypothetical protein
MMTDMDCYRDLSNAIRRYDLACRRFTRRKIGESEFDHQYRNLHTVLSNSELQSLLAQGFRKGEDYINTVKTLTKIMSFKKIVEFETPILTEALGSKRRIELIIWKNISNSNGGFPSRTTSVLQTVSLVHDNIKSVIIASRQKQKTEKKRYKNCVRDVVAVISGIICVIGNCVRAKGCLRSVSLGVGVNCFTNGYTRLASFVIAHPSPQQ